MRISDWSSDVCSSDLVCAAATLDHAPPTMLNGEVAGNEGYGIVEFLLRRQAVSAHAVAVPMATALVLIFRSEEHTSELQSLMRISYAVFCLKKKKKKNITPNSLSMNSNHSQTRIATL